jgi:HK97 family phage major capsid protein
MLTPDVSLPPILLNVTDPAAAIRARRREAFAAVVTALVPALRGWSPTASADLPPEILWRAARASWATTPPVTATGLLPPSPPAGFRTTLSDVLVEIPATGLLRVPSFTPPATPGAPHAEGAAKTEAVLAFGPGSDQPLRSVATTVAVTDELLEDAPQFAAWLDRYLEFLVALGEERQLLLGNGVAPNVLGYFAWPGIPTFAGTATTVGGTLAAAAAAVAEASGGLEADTYVVSAADWATVLDDGGAEFAGQTAFLHGRLVVPTPALTAGQMLVGAVQMASVLGRSGGIRVESTQSHDVNFTKNVSNLRAASRIALGVIQPTAFTKVAP